MINWTGKAAAKNGIREMLLRRGLPDNARVALDELMAMDGRSASNVLTRAIEEYWDRRLFEAGNAAYADLRRDPAAWAAYQAECAELDGTLMDGLSIAGGE